MAINIGDAEAYIAQYVIVTEDWDDSDPGKKQRLLNVAARTLMNKYPTYTIPDNAVYDFSAKLANVYNDTNKLQQEGVKSFNISGVTSFTFNGGEKTLEQLIPQTALQLIGEANGITLGTRRTGRTVL